MPRSNNGSARVKGGASDPLSLAVTRRDGSALANVERALAASEVMLAYQPIMQARAPQGTAFYEGLIRVLDETGRVIPAGQFMTAAEDSELGRKLDNHALKMGLRALAEHPELRLSINMSARSIGFQPWRKTLNRFLNKDATIGERLILEITETSAMLVPEILSRFMIDMQRHGICFALDDYGSGLSAVRFFKDFQFDAVKIDGQFIAGIHADPDKQVVTAALVSVARQFDMFTIAAKIEDPKDAAFVMAMGVDCLQGYLFGAPSIRPPWLPQQNTAQSA